LSVYAFELPLKRDLAYRHALEHQRMCQLEAA
jgi:hypothetical protein